jgi:hypothetical protein
MAENTQQNRRDFPRFSNSQIMEMSDYELNNTINEFQAYIRRERKANRNTVEAECECAYLLNERDERNR